MSSIQKKGRKARWTVAFTMANGRTVYPNDFNKSAQIARFTPDVKMAKVVRQGEARKFVFMAPPGAKTEIVMVGAA